MKIDLKKKILNFKKEVIKSPDGDLTLGEVLSNVALNEKTGGKMKLFVLAQELYTKDEINLDKADFELLRKAIENSRPEELATIVAGQILVYFSELKDELKEESDKK